MINIINWMPLILLNSLFWTIVIELLGAWLLQVRKSKDLFNILLANIITNPIVTSMTFTINIYYGIFIKNIWLIILEILAWFVEGTLYKKYLTYTKINPYLLSLILNVGSYSIGIFINQIIW